VLAFLWEEEYSIKAVAERRQPVRVLKSGSKKFEKQAKYWLTNRA